ncbi:MAG: polysaccharide biosynthesis tyrosine autokinase [Bryobacteraceae bacterium]|jgi:capsular exopolysaccharide synthesis family protein
MSEQRQLIQRSPSAPGAHALAPADSYRIAYLPGESPQEPGSVPLSQYLWILKRHRWKILSFVFASVLATLIVSSRITPDFEATTIVDIDRRMPTGVLGQEALQSATNDADQFLATQVKLIQSDSVLRPVAQRYKLLEAEGADAQGTVKPADAEDAPVLLKKLKVSRPPNTYLLLISYRSPDPRLAADVANGIAQSYLEHTYNIRYRSSASLSAFMEKQLEELKAKMERSSAAQAQFERELNVINPEEKTSILSARLLQLNTEYTNAQADRVRKEAAFNSVRGGTLEALQVSTQGESLGKIGERLQDAQARFADVKERYGANHPEFRKAAAQVVEVQRAMEAAQANIGHRVEIEYRQATAREGMLNKAVGETKAEFDRLNARSFQYQALKREAEADKRLYEELVRKIKEAGINAGFQNSAIRIADPARPALKPVFPNLKLNLLLAFMFSSVLAMGAAVVSDVLDNTVRDAEQVARTLKTEVIGNLPMVKPWHGKLAPISAAGDGVGSLVLHTGNGDQALSSYEEAIRTLRNSILLADFERNLRSLLVTSALPGEGKSTIAAHLAVTHARQGHRTLLIDADLRRPSVHKRFGIPGAVGLSTTLVADSPWRDAVLKLEQLPELEILPAGPSSRRAADLIGRGLSKILTEAAETYDIVILDAPPMLGFAEPLQIATAVDGVIVVARAGETNRKAVATVLGTLQRLRANVVGMVLNEMTGQISDSYYYYGYHGKYHRYYSPSNGTE